MSGLVVPGKLSVSIENLVGVGISSLENNLIYNVTMFDTVEVERSKVDGSTSFTNYIETYFNLNEQISYTTDATIDDATIDDAYALNEINVYSSSGITPNLFLPDASNISVDVGEIDTTDQNTTSIGKFFVKLSVSCSHQGIMSTEIAISGQDGNDYVSTNVYDNPNLAQKAYWPDVQSAPVIDANSADILNTKITVNELTTLYNTELTNINNQYNNQNMVMSWTIKIDAILASTDNTLSKHARFIGKGGRTDIFEEGDKMMASTPFLYGVSIIDYLGNATTIITPTNVYGVLSHKEVL